MAIIITIILIAIMIKVLNYFHMPALINLQKSILQFIKKKKNFRQEVTKNSRTKGQNWMSKIPIFRYCNHKVNASKYFRINILKFRNQNLSEMNGENSFHFWFNFYMSWKLLYLTSKFSLLSIFLDVYLHGMMHVYRNNPCISLLEITLKLINSEHYSLITL